MIKIGYIHDFYFFFRCIINKITDNEKVTYKKIGNMDFKTQFYRIKRKLKLPVKNNPNQFIFRPINNNFDILHTFNTICYTKKPWIVTFETLLPRREEVAHYHHEISNYRITENVKKDILAMASDNCKKIIALSECNKKIQEEFLKNFDKNIAERIKDKLIVMHPPQKLLLTQDELKQKIEKKNNEINFLFIGNQFFRKGGKEIIKVLTKFRQEHKKRFRLTIISNFTPDIEFTRTNEIDKNNIIQFVIKNKDWIQWYKDINNNEVLEIAKKCDVGLLPTFADTYGYSVLEMQAAGMPVITTNIRALPEINKAGWICNIPVNYFNEALYSKDSSLNKMKEILQNELERNIKEILDNPDIIKIKGLKAYEYISKHHSPIDYGNKLYEIYKNVL